MFIFFFNLNFKDLIMFLGLWLEFIYMNSIICVFKGNLNGSLICLFSYMKFFLVYTERFLKIFEGKDVFKSRGLDR